jgi:hypothetical protein
MQQVQTNLVGIHPRLNKFILPAIILFLLVATGMVYYSSTRTETAPPADVLLSQSALEEQYGLRVNLIGVTAAGGMVDLRMKIVDGEKAKSLLQDKANFPVLYISKGHMTLNAPEDAKSQEIKFENDGNLFLLYPNTGNAVRRGARVIVVFGNTALEAIEAK